MKNEKTKAENSNQPKPHKAVKLIGGLGAALIMNKKTKKSLSKHAKEMLKKNNNVDLSVACCKPSKKYN
ncbi:MAG: hypothetical protein M1480_20665 [Bacteroidetes bacterium]|nr:hypothetical protein [Bacteroidota bacterium]